jgi:hypothetical protein
LKLEAPATYRGGRTYRLRVTLQRKGLQVGGFEVAARFASGPSSGRQAGTLRETDERVQVIAGKGILYAQHTEAGSRSAARGALEWLVEWRAPSEPAGPVVFHVAANAANGDYSALGDTIHTAEFVSRPYSSRSATTASTEVAR